MFRKNAWPLLPQLLRLALQRFTVVAEALDQVFCLSRLDVKLVREVADFVFLPAGDANTFV
jgi:hypothetical protein